MNVFERWVARGIGVIFLLWFGWQLTAQTVVSLLKLRQQVAVTQQALKQCEAAKAAPTAKPEAAKEK